jgi:hypothetical protein
VDAKRERMRIPCSASVIVGWFRPGVDRDRQYERSFQVLKEAYSSSAAPRKPRR